MEHNVPGTAAQTPAAGACVERVLSIIAFAIPIGAPLCPAGGPRGAETGGFI